MKLLVKCAAWFILALSGGATGAADIDWNHWELAAFEAAKAQDKVILLSVGMEGCAACARMESITYTNPGVIDLINEHFIAIEVDAEARPDIGERYSDWAWPATTTTVAPAISPIAPIASQFKITSRTPYLEFGGTKCRITYQ